MFILKKLSKFYIIHKKIQGQRKEAVVFCLQQCKENDLRLWMVSLKHNFDIEFELFRFRQSFKIKNHHFI